MELSESIKEIYNSDFDTILVLVGDLIKQKPDDHDYDKNINLLNELKVQNNLKSEIWFGERDVWWSPGDGYLALVDDKAVMRYTIVLTDYKGIIKLTYFIKCMETKNRISREKLLSKKTLNKRYFILDTYDDIDKIYYEDEKEAFEITGESLGLENYYSLKGEILKNYNILIFSYAYENRRFGGKIDEFFVTGALNLDTLEVFIINERVVSHPS
jgi:hypothetical protein